MLSRAPRVARMARVPRRGMATTQQLKMRITSVTNIQKITKAMKMVAAAKVSFLIRVHAWGGREGREGHEERRVEDGSRRGMSEEPRTANFKEEGEKN